MKKFIGIILAFILILSVFSSCSNHTTATTTTPTPSAPHIIGLEARQRDNVTYYFAEDEEVGKFLPIPVEIASDNGQKTVAQGIIILDYEYALKTCNNQSVIFGIKTPPSSILFTNTDHDYDVMELNYKSKPIQTDPVLPEGYKPSWTDSRLGIFYVTTKSTNDPSDNKILNNIQKTSEGYPIFGLI